MKEVTMHYEKDALYVNNLVTDLNVTLEEF